MSIYNRKMFKRNARNALNSSAGIAPVQKFTGGGTVNRPPLRFSPAEAARLRQLASPPTLQQRLTGILDFDKGASGAAQRLLGPPSSRFGTRALQKTLGGIGYLGDLTASGTGALASLFTGQPDKGAGTKSAPSVLAPGVLESLNDPNKPIPEDMLGVDLMTVPGFDSGTKPPPVPRGFAGQTVQITPEGAKFKPRPETPLDVFKADTEMTNIDMGPEEAEMQRIAMADADMPNPRAEQDFQAAVDAADRDEQDQQAAMLGQQTQKDESVTGPKPRPKIPVEDQPNVEPEAITPEQVAETLTADPETQEQALSRLMKEFTQNAPEYKGVDKGLALAKIGFAMAAGKSPNAIENIASAMEQGADMLIKDKEKRDSFNRQVKLSALQYGLGEVGKERAEARLAKREDDKLKYFIADKDVTIGGKTYEKGGIVPITQGYIRENGLPSGITTENLSKAAIDKAAEIEKIIREQNKDKIMTDKDYRANRKIITEASDTFSKARNLQTLVEGQMFKVADGRITGLGPAAKSLLNKAANTVGVNLKNASLEDLEKYNADMRKVANELIKELLGEGSKNISNVDRELAQEIVGLYTQYSYISADPDVLIRRLQGVYDKLGRAQRTSLADMEDILQASQGRTFQSGQAVRYGRVGEVIGSVRGDQNQIQTVKFGDLLTDGTLDQKKVSSIFGLT